MGDVFTAARRTGVDGRSKAIRGAVGEHEQAVFATADGDGPSAARVVGITISPRQKQFRWDFFGQGRVAFLQAPQPIHEAVDILSHFSVWKLARRSPAVLLNLIVDVL
jgi:hypothetical protein